MTVSAYIFMWNDPGCDVLPTATTLKKPLPLERVVAVNRALAGNLSFNSDDDARCLEYGAGPAAGRKAHPRRASVRDDGGEDIAAADFDIDLSADRSFDHVGDRAADDVPCAQLRVQQERADDDRAGFDDSAGGYALFQGEPFNGAVGYDRNDLCPVGKGDRDLGIDGSFYD